MQRIGCVLHISSNKNIILKAESLPRIGDKVVDKRLRSIGSIFSIFGPTSSPYIAVKPDVEDVGHLVNHTLYALPSPRLRKTKK